jgi:hypothetical protein
MRRRTQAARTLGGRAPSRAADGFATLDVLKRSTKADARLREPSGGCRTRTRSLPNVGREAIWVKWKSI